MTLCLILIHLRGCISGLIPLMRRMKVMSCVRKNYFCIVKRFSRKKIAKDLLLARSELL